MTNNEIIIDTESMFYKIQTLSVYINIGNNTIKVLLNSDAIYLKANEVMTNGFWTKECVQMYICYPLCGRLYDFSTCINVTEKEVTSLHEYYRSILYIIFYIMIFIYCIWHIIFIELSHKLSS